MQEKQLFIADSRAAAAILGNPDLFTTITWVF
jgi:hypothetical protein